MSGGRKRKGKAGRSKPSERKAETPGPSAGQRSGRASVPRARGPQPAPIEVNGWKLYTWAAFRDRWDGLVAAVDERRSRDPKGYKRHPQTRFLALVRIVMEDVPRDPSDPRYAQGKTLGSDYAHWRRAKFARRFRLFFRYHSGAKIIVYVWLNDEDTLRKAGNRTDVYATFRAMLERERPPTDWDDLIATCETWRMNRDADPDVSSQRQV